MRLFSLLLLSFLLTPHTSHAGGFQLNAQGQRQLGMGHCGTGLLLDESCLFFNPGACSFLEHKFYISAGTNMLLPRTVYHEPAPGIYTDTMVHHVGTPFELYAMFRCKNFSAGLAVYTPFGSKAEWPSDWKGAALIQEISLKTIFIQPTISYKFNEHIGVGVGFIYATGGFELKKQVPVQDSLGSYGQAVLDGEASGIGYNIGLYIKINEHWSAGICHRSRVQVIVKNGTANFTVPASLANYFPSTTFTTQIDLPESFNFGVGYSCCKWKLAADLNLIGWHSYDSLRITFAEHTDKLEDVRDPRMYEDAYIARIGAEYTIDASCAVRFGMYFDHSPVPDGYLTPETPDSDRLGITAGATVKANKKLSFDFSLLYIEAMKRTDTNVITGFSGTYKTRVIAPGMGLNFQF